MKLFRPLLSLTFLAPIFWLATSSIAGAREPPTGADIKHGTLVWIRGIREIVPFSTQLERVQWEQDKAEALASLPADQQGDYALLRSLSFDEFQSLYFYDQDPRSLQPFSGAGLGVGH